MSRRAPGLPADLPRHLRRCHRCGKKNRGQADWNVTLRCGIPTAATCAGCQTSAEHIEAQVNEATTDYTADALGRITGHPKAATDAD